MFKRYFIFVLMICCCTYLTSCTSENPTTDDLINSHYQEPVHEEISISDYPFIKDSVDSIINELSFNEAFNDLAFVEAYKNDEGKIIVFYNEKYHNLFLIYDDGLFEGIELSYTKHDDNKFNKSIFKRQILAITKSKKFDINENDFSNDDELSSYTEYLKIISMKPEGDNFWQVTTKEKNLIILFTEDNFETNFSIYVND